MAHEFESGFTVGERSWHGLEVNLREAPTVEEGIRLAGLDWKVNLRPVYAYTGPYQVESLSDEERGSVNIAPTSLEEITSVPDFYAVIRDKDSATLGMVGTKYHPLQNVDAFKFFNPFLENGEAKLETAGSLMGGKRVWVLAKLAEGSAEVIDGDRIEPYLLLFNSFDGSTTIGVDFTNTRVVCNNTLSLAINAGEKAKSTVKIRHTSGMNSALEIVQDAINVGMRQFEFTLQQYREMVKRDLPVSGFEKYLSEVLGVDVEEEKKTRTWKRIRENFENGLGTNIAGVRGTVWAGYNAVTEFVSNQMGRTDEGRRNSNWFGQGAKLRQRAFSEAMALVS